MFMDEKIIFAVLILGFLALLGAFLLAQKHPFLCALFFSALFLAVGLLCAFWGVGVGVVVGLVGVGIYLALIARIIQAHQNKGERK